MRFDEEGEFTAPAGYHDLRRIGGGAQATVFRAVKTSLGKTVALKAFRLDGDSRHSAALEREVSSLQALADHPFVVTVHDRTRSGEHLWLEMDWYSGGSVADWIADGAGVRSRLTYRASMADRVQAAVRFSLQATQALAAAHAQKLLHRDVKPANLLVDSYGNVRLADFGLAVTHDSGDGDTSGRVGTRGFLAPEHRTGGASQAGDVWALGATIRAMALSAVRERDLPATGVSTETEAPHPEHRASGADVGAALLEVAEMMTAEDPRQRISLRHVEQRLRVLEMYTHRGLAPISPLGRSRRFVPIVAAAVTVPLLAVLTVWLLPDGGPGGPTPVTLGASQRTLVSSNTAGEPAAGDSGRPSLDETGRYVAFTTGAPNMDPLAAPGKYNIYRKDRETGRLYLVSVGANGVPADGESQFPVQCRDGRYVAFASVATNLLTDGPELAPGRWRIYVRDTLTDTTFLVSVAPDGGDPDGDSVQPRLSADCSLVVFLSSASNLVPGDRNGLDDVFVRAVPNGPTRLVSGAATGGTGDSVSSFADISPDGTRVAFTSWATDLTGTPNTEPARLYLRDLRSDRITEISGELPPQERDVGGYSWPVFSPDGRHLLFRSLTDGFDVNSRGRHVYVWDLQHNRSAITLPDGSAGWWNDACTEGTSNGTNFSPQIGSASGGHRERILFTVPDSSGCRLVLRDLAGNDVPVRLVERREVLEPAVNATGDVLAWAVAGAPQHVYSCPVDRCDVPSAMSGN